MPTLSPSGQFTNSCKGLIQKKIYREKNFGPLSDLIKISGPSFCHKNYESTHRKAGKLILLENLQQSKKKKGPFLHQPPPPQVFAGVKHNT